jgi:sugar lactone lactonase YvrE
MVAALCLCVLAGAALQAQTAHYGGVITLGSGFSAPNGVAVDANGNVYFADYGHSAVKEIMAVNGSIPASPVINTLGSGFSYPRNVAVDRSGNVFVADYGNSAVKEILAVGGYTTVRTLASGLPSLWGMAVDGRGDVFFSQATASLVKEIVAVNGVIPASPKIITLGHGFNIPTGLAVDGSGNVFLGDITGPNNNAVKEILAAGGYTTTITVTAGFTSPDYVAVDKSGNVFVADNGNSAVNEIVAVNGSIPVLPSVITIASGSFQPAGVAVDGSGNVYLTDTLSNTVKEVRLAGADFGQVNVGTTSLSTQTLYFTIDYAGTLGSSGVAVVTQGNPGMDFYDAGGGTCKANNYYTAGTVCTVTVEFAPLAPGQRYGAVELRNLNGALMATGRLQGIGVGPQATFANTTFGVSNPALRGDLGSGLSGPGGVAVDAAGNVFVGDSNNDMVKEMVASSGWSKVNTLGFAFSFPNGVALDGAGNVYVADTYHDDVREITSDGANYVLDFGFSNPYGVAVDGLGNVFVADFGNNAVKEIVALNGSISNLSTTRTLAGGLNGPDGVAVDGNGNVFFANYGDGTVQEIVAVDGSIPASPTIKTILSGLSGPSNLSVDGIGDIFVADTGNNQVEEIVAAGGYTTVKIVGSEFSFPEAVAVDGYGNVIVADTGNNAVELLDYVDQPVLVFGPAPVGLTSINSPERVTVTNNGNAPLIFPLPTTGTNPSVPANFVWDATSTCIRTTPGSSQPFALAAGASCTMALDFKPATAGALTGNLVLTDNSLNVAGASQTIQMSGTGIAPATIQSPTPGTVLAGPRVTFTWSTAAGATAYGFRLGTTLGANNLYSSGTVTTTTAAVSGLPTNGETIHARLITYYGSRQVYTDYIYTAATRAALTSPTPSTVLSGPQLTFNWAAATGGGTGYGFRLGTTAGAANLYSSGTTTATSATVGGLPTNGSTIYARLITYYGSSQVYSDYVFSAATKAALTSPTPSTVLAGPKVKFSWTAAPGATSYHLWLGTSVGANNLYASGPTTATTATPTNLPTNGETINARLYTVYGSSQVYTDYVYTAQ